MKPTSTTQRFLNHSYAFSSGILSTLIRYKFLLIILLLQAIVCEAQQPNTWTKKADYAGGKIQGAASFCINDIGFVGTGDRAETVSSLTTRFYKYDPLTDIWQKISDLPATSRVFSLGFSVNQKGYICGGLFRTVLGSDILSDLWEYDPITNEWFQRKSFPRVGGIESGIGFSIGSKGYVGLGYSEFVDFEHQYGVQNDFYEYDPLYNKWTQLGDFMGAPRMYAVGFSMDGKGYVGLGSSLESVEYKDFWEYNPSNDRWTRLPDFPGFSSSSAYGFGINGVCYVGLSSPCELYKYDTKTKTWDVLAYPPGASRYFAFSFCAKNKIYMGGGVNTAQPIHTNMADLWEYLAPMNSTALNETKPSNLSLYINQATNTIYVQSEKKLDSSVTFYYSSGIALTLKIESGNSINIEKLPKGFYLVSIKTVESEMFIKKVLKE